MSEGAGHSMMNRKSWRLLTTLVLAAAICAALGSEVQAAGKGSLGSSSASYGSRAPKPGATPMTGEPDSPGNGPLPPKDGKYSTSARSSMWVQRIQWSVRVWLDQMPKRYP